MHRDVQVVKLLAAAILSGKNPQVSIISHRRMKRCIKLIASRLCKHILLRLNSITPNFTRCLIKYQLILSH